AVHLGRAIGEFTYGAAAHFRSERATKDARRFGQTVEGIEQLRFGCAAVALVLEAVSTLRRAPSAQRFRIIFEQCVELVGDARARGRSCFTLPSHAAARIAAATNDRSCSAQAGLAAYRHTLNLVIRVGYVHQPGR